MKLKKNRGFTLIELMVVIAIIAILAAFAFPSYQRYVLRSHRVEARNALQEIASRLQQNYSVTRQWNKLGDNTKVTDGDTLPKKWNLDKTPVTGTAHYTITVVSISATEYQLKATAVGPQLKDTCLALFLDQSGTKAAMGSTSAALDNKGRDKLSIECWSS